MEVNVKGSGVLTELGSIMDLNDRKAISEMEESLEQRVLELMNNAWTEVKRLKADVTGFAVRVHRSDPKRWKQIEQEKHWDSVFRRSSSALRSRLRWNGPDSATNRSSLSSRSKGAYL